MGFLDAIFGSDPETTTINTQGPRTEEGQKLWDQFMQVYGQGGAFDPAKQAGQYAGWQDKLYGASPTNLNMPGGGSIPILSPFLKQKTNAINNTMGTSYAPFLQAVMQLEQLRNGTQQPVTQQGSGGLLGSLALPAGLWAAGGFPGLSSLTGASEANPVSAFTNSTTDPTKFSLGNDLLGSIISSGM
jgi:hypothetical protein